jgi:alkanesulfonate monooxygenase SsuD/methylene tetrahydromethanopterin reductase-like flavin-dependent oxidoreductase (luciferase family)
MTQMSELTFGLALDLGSTRPLDDQLADARPLLGDAADAGVASVWVGESYHSSPQPFHLPSALITLAHLAALTPLRLGTGVLLARGYHPRRLAYEAALVDQLSGGRLTLGLGLGTPDLRGDLGGPDRPGGAALDDLLVEMRRSWIAAAAADAGESPPDAPSPVVPAPMQPGGPKLLVGGQGEAAARRAATLADGYYAATNYSDELLRAQSARYRAHLPEGRTPTIAVNRLCLVDTSTARIRSATEEFGEVTRYYTSRGLWNIGGSSDGSSPVLAGSPEEVAERLEQYRDWGVAQVQLRLLPAGASYRTAARTLQLLSELI